MYIYRGRCHTYIYIDISISLSLYLSLSLSLSLANKKQEKEGSGGEGRGGRDGSGGGEGEGRGGGSVLLFIRCSDYRPDTDTEFDGELVDLQHRYSYSLRKLRSRIWGRFRHLKGSTFKRALGFCYGGGVRSPYRAIGFPYVGIRSPYGPLLIV